MTAPEHVAQAQAHLCEAFFAMAGASEDPAAIDAADKALWALDAALEESADSPSALSGT
ncbi:ABC transporter ATP-binding protein [Streptomyces sp. NPDC088116]|uniref:ABC transporter ATP-binding protein n=1 Tax=Streptomyces sp. NPDC088116 TaxID=3365825 RepID=UPI003823F2CF